MVVLADLDETIEFRRAHSGQRVMVGVDDQWGTRTAWVLPDKTSDIAARAAGRAMATAGLFRFVELADPLGEGSGDGWVYQWDAKGNYERFPDDVPW